MQYTTGFLAALALAGSAVAQRPTNTSICDYYTTALLKNNTAEQQLTVLTLLVNTVVIGNYTKPTIPGVTFPDVLVPGILANGTVNGTHVNLLPYFNGGLASSNRGGSSGVSVNFLDDGGAVPLMANMPANGTTSNQYFLLTHLYQFFGTALACSKQGMTGYPAYSGDVSMYDVHKFMNLNYAETTYFIQQVGLAAMSFGVAMDDIQIVAKTLGGSFNVKCAPTSGPLESLLGPQLQSICIADDCPLAPNATCSAYGAAVAPGISNSTLAQGEGNASSTATATAANGGHISASATGASASGAGGASATAASTGAAATLVAGSFAAGLAGLAALVL